MAPIRSTACYNWDYGSRDHPTGAAQRKRRDQGETFIVTRNGVPVGELTPLRRHRFVSADTAIAVFRTAPAIDRHRFRADLDAVADQEATPRG